MILGRSERQVWSGASDASLTARAEVFWIHSSGDYPQEPG